MSTITEAVEIRGYNLLGNLDDEQDAIDSFLGNGYSGYICDVISEVADNHIPIYNGDIWENVADIQEYVEEAISSGIAPVNHGDVDLIRIFQAGYYEYYSQALYNSLNDMVFNYIAEKVNEHLSSLDNEALNAIDIDAVTEAVEGKADNIDNNDTFNDMDDAGQEIIDAITDGEYAL